MSQYPPPPPPRQSPAAAVATPPPPPPRPPGVAPPAAAGETQPPSTAAAPVAAPETPTAAAPAAAAPAPFPTYESTRSALGVPTNQEPYGQVNIPAVASTMKSRRPAPSYGGTNYYSAADGQLLQQPERSPSSSYTGKQHMSFTYGGASGGAASSSTTLNKTMTYSHNGIMLCWLLPSLSMIFMRHDSVYPMYTLLFVCLIGYSLDLANLRSILDIVLWFGIAIVGAISGWFILLDEGDEAPGVNDHGMIVILLMLRITTQIFLLSCWGCWITLQFQWLHKESPERAMMLQHFLHATVPVISSALLSFHLINYFVLDSNILGSNSDIDLAATLLPHMFALLLSISMLMIGCAKNSYSKNTATTTTTTTSDNNNTNGANHKQQQQTTTTNDTAAPATTVEYAISPKLARFHSILLLLGPPLIHLSIFLRRILSSYASYDELFDLLLVCTLPYLLHYGIHLLHVQNIRKGPYHSFRFFRQTTSSQTNLVPMVFTLICSLAVQNRYMIPLCHTVAYLFQGHESPSTMLISMYLHGAMISLLFSVWLWGRKSTSKPDEPLFGEYQEDLIQLSFIAGGFFVGKAMGMPWSLLPLPILALLGICLWATTGLLRYLTVFLFVLDAAGVVLLGYRFAGMDNIEISISFFYFTFSKINLGLVRFGTVIVLTSCVVCLVAGLAVRSSGGYGAKYIRKFDITGGLLALYSILLMILECTLITQPIPIRELSGIELDISDMEDSYDNETLYDHSVGFTTSVLLIGLAYYLKKYHTIKAFSSLVIMSCACGKAIALFIDLNTEFTTVQELVNKDDDRYYMVVRSLSCMILFVMIVAPTIFLKPIHMKSTRSTTRRKYYGAASTGSPTKTANGKPSVEIPKNGKSTVLVYTLFLLPLSIIIAVPYVLFPLMDVFSNNYYYETAKPITELIGYGLVIWGVACLHMLNHYLPDGGGEVYKKAFACTFLMGIGIIVAAPTLPINATSSAASRSMPIGGYAKISSLGVQLMQRTKSRSGGWGLLSASLATLLAITGPLELRERKYTSGQKDNSFLARLMTFSVLFGCGVAWFILIQSMSEENTLMLVVSCVACMAIAFFGTVTATLGFFLELENFDEVEQVAQVWMVAFPILVIVSSIPQIIVRESMHPFGTGGWLSTYLSICAIITFSFSLALRYRGAKNSVTRGLGNISCVFSWICTNAVLYGRYGVAGLDSDFGVTTLMGFPASIVGTFFTSLILLLLEGEEESQGKSNRVQRLSSGPAATKRRNSNQSTTGVVLNLQRLNQSTRFIPLVAGTVFILLLASVYTITLRGSGFLSVFVGSSAAAKNHAEVYSKSFTKPAGKSAGNDFSTGEEDNKLDLAALAEKTIIHSKAIATSAKLAGSGFWTSEGFMGPLLHLGGVVAALPSLYLFVAQAWYGKKITSTQVTTMLPLNAIPLLLCSGIPSLRAAAIVGIIGGCYQIWNIRRLDYKSRMRI